jgi:2-oxoglutarate ferredoxin oxidoreductase subunit gamma
VIADSEPDFPLVTRLDALVVLDQSAVKISQALIDADSVVLVDADLVPEPPAGDFQVTALSLIDEARRLRNVRVANVVSLGALISVAGICEFAALEDAVGRLTPEKFRALNLDALSAGRRLVQARENIIAGGRG